MPKPIIACVKILKQFKVKLDAGDFWLSLLNGVLSLFYPNVRSFIQMEKKLLSSVPAGI